MPSHPGRGLEHFMNFFVRKRTVYKINRNIARGQGEGHSLRRQLTPGGDFPQLFSPFISPTSDKKYKEHARNWEEEFLALSAGEGNPSTDNTFLHIRRPLGQGK